MSEQEYDNRKIVDYLLGNLPETEAEHFDELSFTDDEFAARLESAEKDLIDSYVNGELSEIEREKFKSHYLASPLRRDKVRFAEAFQGFAKQNLNEINLEKKKPVASESEQTTSFFSALNIFANPAWRWAFAALILALIVGGFVFVRRQFDQPINDVAVTGETPAPSIAPPSNENTNLETVVEPPTENQNINVLPNSNREIPKKMPTPQSSVTPKPEKTLTPPKPLVASFFFTPPLRGAGGLQNISFPKETSTIRITLKLEGNDYKIYRVSLADEAGKNLRQIGNLQSRNETLNVSFPAKLLKPQIYSLIVSGINPNGEAEIIGNYSFRAVLR